MKAKIYYGSFYSIRNQINKDKASFRIDCHFNSHTSNANYSLAMTKSGDLRSYKIGETLARITAGKLNIRNNSVKVVGGGQTGYTIVRQMNCPVVLWEPCFVSNSEGARIAKHERNKLHEAFLETLSKEKMNGLMALVAGHAHKRTGDPGASVVGGGTEAKYTDLLVQELAGLINSKDMRGDNDMGFRAYQSTRPEKEAFIDKLFTGSNALLYGKAYMSVRTDPLDSVANFHYYVIKRDGTVIRVPGEEDKEIAVNHAPHIIELAKYEDFSIHLESDFPVLVAVDQF